MSGKDIKLQIAATALDALFNYGLPALAKVVNNLNDKEKVTLEDIENIGKEMKESEDYFK